MVSFDHGRGRRCHHRRNLITKVRARPRPCGQVLRQDHIVGSVLQRLSRVDTLLFPGASKVGDSRTACRPFRTHGVSSKGEVAGVRQTLCYTFQTYGAVRGPTGCLVLWRVNTDSTKRHARCCNSNGIEPHYEIPGETPGSQPLGDAQIVCHQLDAGRCCLCRTLDTTFYRADSAVEESGSASYDCVVGHPQWAVTPSGPIPNDAVCFQKLLGVATAKADWLRAEALFDTLKQSTFHLLTPLNRLNVAGDKACQEPHGWVFLLAGAEAHGCA